MAAIPTNVAQLVGRTPMIALPRLLQGAADGVELYGKLEALNPGAWRLFANLVSLPLGNQ